MDIKINRIRISRAEYLAYESKFKALEAPFFLSCLIILRYQLQENIRYLAYYVVAVLSASVGGYFFSETSSASFQTVLHDWVVGLSFPYIFLISMVAFRRFALYHTSLGCFYSTNEVERSAFIDYFTGDSVNIFMFRYYAAGVSSLFLGFSLVRILISGLFAALYLSGI